MRITFPKIQRSLVVFCAVIILIGSLSSCTQSTGPGGEDESQLEEPQSGGEAHILNYSAHREELHQGECTVLEWQVQGGYSVNLNGQPVGFEGVMDICPEQTTTYWLEVDGGDRMVDSQVTIHVMGSPSPGDGDAPAEQPPPPVDGDALAEQPPPPAPEGSSPPANPPKNKATDTPKNCNKTSTEFITDLAITDIYPGNSPKGQFWVRITNNGPVACQNVNLQSLDCTAAFTPKSGQSGSAVSVNKIPVMLNIGPGETQNVPTGLELDFDKASYLVTCSLGLTGIQHKDLNISNEYYQENLP